ncbi:MAG: hypothetical protein ACJAZC_000561 [Cryomorphaceae bacterium]|jgi:hypothetical protein
MKYGKKLLFKSTSIVISEPIPKMGCNGGVLKEISRCPSIPKGCTVVL